MAKDPAFLFYSSDFLTGTMTMTNEQVGKYVRLLCLQHQKGELTEEDMIFVCCTYDKVIFDKFIKTETGYFNERLRLEADKRANYCNSRRLNKDGKTHKKHTKKIRKTHDLRMEDENEIVNNTNIKLTKEEKFYLDLSKVEEELKDERFAKFKEWCNELLSDCENTFTMKKPLTSFSFYKLIKRYGKDLVVSKLRYLDNKTNIHDYSDTYKVVINWCNDGGKK